MSATAGKLEEMGDDELSYYFAVEVAGLIPSLENPGLIREFASITGAYSDYQATPFATSLDACVPFMKADKCILWWANAVEWGVAVDNYTHVYAGTPARAVCICLILEARAKRARE